MTQTEEYLKEAIMDENHAVSSAGLVCALHLLKKDPGIGNKVSEQVGKAVGTFGLKKFHALCLLFRMQQIESLGVGELARTHIEEILSYELKYNDKAIFYPLSVCLVIRFITQISRASDYCKYLKSCIFEEGDVMVAIEGLRSMKQLRNISSSEVEAAIDAVRMRLFNSCKAVVWFGGFRAMHEHQIHCHLEADDVTQVVKSKTEAPAADNLRRRRLQNYIPSF